VFTGVTLVGLGLGTLLRHSSSAIAALFGANFVAPVLVFAFPSSWGAAIAKYLPSNAGQAILRTVGRGPGPRGPAMLSPWVGPGVFAAYAAVTLLLAAWSITRRDA
jgi:hypothetical protein